MDLTGEEEPAEDRASKKRAFSFFSLVLSMEWGNGFL